MAAAQTVSQLPLPRKSPISKSGVLTLSGFAVRVRSQNGHLEIEDGVGLERRKFRLPRVGHGLKRLIVIGNDGYVSLGALQWLADQDVSLTFLDRKGKVLFVSGPTAPSDARLRRAQALAVQNGTALEISRELISAKLAGQETLVREKLRDTATADVVARCRERLSSADCLEVIRSLESQGAAAYWGAWADVPVMYPRKEVKRVPQHWRVFGTRKSPLTGSPRLAINPPGAILNYCYGLLESEARLALAALGLDPGLGMLHLDAPARDSMACDVMEAIRPAIDAWLLDWLTREPFLRSWFVETETGNCRLTRDFAAKLSETAPTWGRLVAPYAERVASLLWSRRRKPSSEAVPPTRLTQRHKREGKGAPSFPPADAPRPQTLCRECGKDIDSGRTHCVQCAVGVATDRLIKVAHTGRLAAHTAEAEGRRSETQRRQATARYAWRASDQPTWLTAETYTNRIQPALANLTNGVIASALGVSRVYAAGIRRGERRPHPRHWRALARVAGVSPDLG